MGNRYLRKLLVVGAHAVLYNRKGRVALANTLARIAPWPATRQKHP